MRSGEAKSTKYLNENLLRFSPSIFQVKEVISIVEEVEDSDVVEESDVVETGGDTEAAEAIASTLLVELSAPISLKRPDLWKEFQEQNHLQKLLNHHYQEHSQFQLILHLCIQGFLWHHSLDFYLILPFQTVGWVEAQYWVPFWLCHYPWVHF